MAELGVEGQVLLGHIDVLPDHVLAYVCSFLPVSDVCRLALTCQGLRDRLSSIQNFWENQWQAWNGAPATDGSQAALLACLAAARSHSWVRQHSLRPRRLTPPPAWLHTAPASSSKLVPVSQAAWLSSQHCSCLALGYYDGASSGVFLAQQCRTCHVPPRHCCKGVLQVWVRSRLCAELHLSQPDSLAWGYGLCSTAGTSGQLVHIRALPDTAAALGQLLRKAESSLSVVLDPGLTGHEAAGCCLPDDLIGLVQQAATANRTRTLQVCHTVVASATSAARLGKDLLLQRRAGLRVLDLAGVFHISASTQQQVFQNSNCPSCVDKPSGSAHATSQAAAAGLACTNPNVCVGLDHLVDHQANEGFENQVLDAWSEHELPTSAQPTATPCTPQGQLADLLYEFQLRHQLASCSCPAQQSRVLQEILQHLPQNRPGLQCLLLPCVLPTSKRLSRKKPGHACHSGSKLCAPKLLELMVPVMTTVRELLSGPLPNLQCVVLVCPDQQSTHAVRLLAHSSLDR